MGGVRLERVGPGGTLGEETKLGERSKAKEKVTGPEDDWVRVGGVVGGLDFDLKGRWTH